MNAGMLRGIAARATVDPLSLPPVSASPDGTTPRALVAVASPQGSTMQVGRAIAGDLRRAGIDAELRDLRDVENLAGYDAVIVGSAIHSHHWMRSATEFVERLEVGVAARMAAEPEEMQIPLAQLVLWKRPKAR